MSTIDAPLVYVTQSGQIIPSGYTSSNLPQGVKGPQGDKGPQGVQGAKGDTGVKGDKGVQGDKGDKGDTGVKGAQGVQGVQGDKGAKGEKGAKGAKGDTGVKGAQGEKGVQGDKGDTGVKGAQGDTGVKGAKGEKGESRLLHQYAQSRAGEQVKITVVTAANNPTVDLNDISIVEEPSHGNIVSKAAGVLTYQADVRYLGPDWFRYEVANKNRDLPKLQGTMAINISSSMLPLSEGDRLRFIYAIDGGSRKVKEYNGGVTETLFTPEGSRIANALATNRDDNVVYYAWKNELWAYDYLRDVQFKVATISGNEGPFSDAVSHQGGPTEIQPYASGTYHNSVYYFTGLSNSGSKNYFSKIVPLASINDEIDNRLGYSVEINGEYAIVGASKDDSWKGAAYIFKNDGTDNWSELVKLTAIRGEGGDNFGYSVAINGDYAIVGAMGDDSRKGSAYIFKNDGSDNWSELVKLTAIEGEEGDKFGVDVAINGNYAIIGAPDEGTVGILPGAAYIFKNDGSDNWSELVKLAAIGGKGGDYFGYSVAINGNYAIVGAMGDDSWKGSAYIFKNDGSDNWNELVKLTAIGGEDGDNFGYSVAINGDYAIIGAPDEGTAGILPGAAYIFKNDESDNWSELVKLTAMGGEGGDKFGGSVAINGNYAIVGAMGDDSRKGVAYIFNKDYNGSDMWGKVSTFTGEVANNEFGYSVAIEGPTALVGAPKYPDGVDEIGRAYIYKVIQDVSSPGYYRVVLAPYEREDGKAPEQKILDVNFIPWSDNNDNDTKTKELGNLAYNSNSRTLMVVSNNSNNPAHNQISICDPSSGKILHTAPLSVSGPNNKIIWDPSGSIILAQSDPNGVGIKLRSLNIGTGYVGPILRELKEENIGDLAEWISQNL